MAKKEKKKLSKRLFNKRRLVIINEETFEELFSLKLNLMNVFVIITISSILLVATTTYFVAFTPLREYIPGYTSTQLRKEAMHLALQSDSLTKKMTINDEYIKSIKKVLLGNVEYAKLNKDSIIAVQKQKINSSILNASETEKDLIETVRQEDKYNLFDTAKPKVNFVLSPPIQGKIIDSYNAKNNNLSVTVATSKNTPVKAIAAGTIIFSDWTPSSNYTTIIRHQDGILSIYKNMENTTKNQGAIVKSGEVIALSSTPLHFELWKDGFPINPEQFINFEH